SAGGTMVHEALGHGLGADLTGDGLSIYEGRVGETIASPLVTVYDDATLAGKRGSFAIDDEGTPAERTPLGAAGGVCAPPGECPSPPGAQGCARPARAAASPIASALSCA